MAYRFGLQTMRRTVFIAAVHSTDNAGNQRTKHENNGTSNSNMGSRNANNGSAGAVCAGVYAAQSGRRLRHRRPTLLLDRTSVLPSATQQNMLQRRTPCCNTVHHVAAQCDVVRCCCMLHAARCMLHSESCAMPFGTIVSSQLHDVTLRWTSPRKRGVPLQQHY